MVVTLCLFHFFFLNGLLADIFVSPYLFKKAGRNISAVLFGLKIEVQITRSFVTWIIFISTINLFVFWKEVWVRYFLIVGMVNFIFCWH